MKTKQKYKFIGKSLLFQREAEDQKTKEKILAIADLHIGHEEAMNKAGIMIPRISFSEIMADLKKIFADIGKVNEIVICGDLKHEFSTISEQEWRETFAVLDYLSEKSDKIILIKGNHDNILEPIARKKNILIRDFYIKEDIAFIHGNKLYPEVLDKKIKIIVMGHRHPAVYISDKYKREKYKCFLVGKWKGKEAIILPSFFPLIEGTDIIEENNLLFIPEKNLRDFSVYVVSDSDVLDFGKLKDI